MNQVEKANAADSSSLASFSDVLEIQPQITIKKAPKVDKDSAKEEGEQNIIMAELQR